MFETLGDDTWVGGGRRVVMVVVYAALLAVGLVLLVTTIVRVLGGGIAQPGAGPPASLGGRGGAGRQVLDERYAAGELSTEEYEHRRRVLERGER